MQKWYWYSLWMYTLVKVCHRCLYVLLTFRTVGISCGFASKKKSRSAATRQRSIRSIGCVRLPERWIVWIKEKLNTFGDQLKRNSWSRTLWLNFLWNPRPSSRTSSRQSGKTETGYNPRLDHINQLDRRESTIVFWLRTGHCGLKTTPEKDGDLRDSPVWMQLRRTDPRAHSSILSTLWRGARQEAWPQDTPLHTKLWGNADDLQRTARFTTASRLKIWTRPTRLTTEEEVRWNLQKTSCVLILASAMSVWNIQMWPYLPKWVGLLLRFWGTANFPKGVPYYRVGLFNEISFSNLFYIRKIHLLHTQTVYVSLVSV